jgi:hypothetical protein
MRKRIDNPEKRKLNVRWSAQEWTAEIRFAPPRRDLSRMVVESVFDTDFLLRKKNRKKTRRPNEFSVWTLRNGHRASWR